MFSYKRIPFELNKVGVTFQRVVDIDFRGLINRSVVVYLDDENISSKKIGNPLKKLVARI